MINFQAGEKLIGEASYLLGEAKRAINSEEWNLAVRRSQEVVELSLKGFLKTLVVDYPKVHDVGEVFSRVVKVKGLKILEATLERIKQISSELAKERAPAFYFEKEYNEKIARKALQEAKWTFRLIKRHFKNLEGKIK